MAQNEAKEKKVKAAERHPPHSCVSEQQEAGTPGPAAHACAAAGLLSVRSVPSSCCGQVSPGRRRPLPQGSLCTAPSWDDLARATSGHIPCPPAFRTQPPGGCDLPLTVLSLWGSCSTELSACIRGRGYPAGLPKCPSHGP